MATIAITHPTGNPVSVNPDAVVWGTMNLTDRERQGLTGAVKTYSVLCFFTVDGVTTQVGTGNVNVNQTAWWAWVELPAGATGDIVAILFTATPGVSSPLELSVGQEDQDPQVTIDDVEAEDNDDGTTQTVTLSGTCTSGQGVSCWYEDSGNPIPPVAATIDPDDSTQWSLELPTVPEDVDTFYAQLTNAANSDWGFAFAQWPEPGVDDINDV